jgi:hypothetical protein
MISPETVDTDVALGFSPIFWNTAWTQCQPPHTMGILCDPTHAALASFPTEFHSNWQWWYLISQAATLELPKGIKPIVQVVPDWFTPKNLGLVVEAKVGNGRLLLTSIDLTQNAVGQQMHRSLEKYMDSEAFQPITTLSVEDIRALIIK